MIIDDSRNVEYKIASTEQLETALGKRYDDRNCFWISHDDDQYPTLGIFVNGDMAYLSYIPREFEAGFRSIGDMGAEVDDMVRFSISEFKADDVDVLREAIVPWSTALSVAKEFFHSKELPKAIEWLQL